MRRNCKVITTCFIGRTVRKNTTIGGDPPGPFNHAQNFPTPEAVLELVALIYDLECKVDPGVESDTIIVNNDVGWEKGNRFLESLHNSKTYSGQLKVVNRENFGRSFGGYNSAYEIFKSQYEYWTFTEDDILVIGDGYFRTCIELFESEAKIGFVAIQGISKEFKLHAHGGVGMTHIRVLDAVYKTLGKLPHRERHQSQAYDDIIVDGEIAFTNSISKLGLDLAEVQSKIPLYAYAYDYMRGIGYLLPDTEQAGHSPTQPPQPWCARQ